MDYGFHHGDLNFSKNDKESSVVGSKTLGIRYENEHTVRKYSDSGRA